VKLLGSKKKRRKEFSRGIIIDVLVEQNFKCASCGKGFTKDRRPHFDHMDGKNSNNRKDNCQALCPNCHDKKSLDENRRRAEIERQKREDPFHIDI